MQSILPLSRAERPTAEAAAGSWMVWCHGNDDHNE